MNNFYYNSVRRSELPLWKRVVLYGYALLFPRKVEAEWQKHVNHMQKMLDNQRYKMFKPKI